ncbi:MAG: ABC transporter substrate-binding protein [Archangiaceae bacterium]|nr:ABC transporter substrate-binding protein [Archangiaceae bacterium]
MRRLLLVAVFFNACSTCDKGEAPDAGAVDAGPLVLDEKEPNNGPDTALVLKSNTVVNANLGADPGKPDEDWYRLESALPRSADVTVTAPNGADIALEVMDEGKNVVTQVNSGGVGATERLPNLDVSGKAWVRVVALKKGAGGAYTLTAWLKDRVPGFEQEPNDRKVDATPVPIGQAVSGFIGHAGDEDWYRYELPNAPSGEAAAPGDAGSEAADASLAAAFEAVGAADAGGGAAPEPEKLALRVDVSGVDGVKLDLAVLTEAEATLFSAKSNVGLGLSLRNVGVRVTDRVIYVVIKSSPTGAGKDAKKAFNAETYYTLTVVPEEAGSSAEFEPNDEAAKATELPRDGYREGFISPRGDVDYFRLKTGGPSLAKVMVSGVEKVDLQLSVVKPGDKEEVLLKANDGAVKEPEMLNNVSCNPDCVFRVEAASRKVDGKWVKDDENGDQAYRITATVVPDDGAEEREPNNSPETATVLELGKPVRGTVFPKKDIDYLKLDLSQRPVKTAIRATLLGILKVDVALFLHRLEEGKLELVGTSDRGKADATETLRTSLEPGVYVFEVRDLKNREANFQDSWQLTVEESDE